MISVHTNRGRLALSAMLVLLAVIVVADSDASSSAGKHGSALRANPIEQLQQHTATNTNTSTVVTAASLEPIEHPYTSLSDGCVLAWEVVDSPQLSDITLLQGVAAIASNDVWAAGYYSSPSLHRAQTLLIHWDGAQWNVAPSPNVDASANFLASLSAIAPDNIWAVGYYVTVSDSVAHTLALHWDGVSWSIVLSPNSGGGGNFLSGVAARAPNDVWAVGDYGYPGPQSLVLHWNGATWTIVPSPSPSSYSVLKGVTALSPTDAWAVGDFDSGSHVYRSLVLHWDGSAWSIVPTPPPNGASNGLLGVAAVSANDIWAVGAGDMPYTLIMHWNGTQWESYPNTFRSFLYAVTALASNDVWAVGGDTSTLIVHWDGASWRTVYSPSPYAPDSLRAVQAVAPNDIWAVGGKAMYSESSATLTERYTGTCVTPTATPTPTPTSAGTATNTSTPTAIVSTTSVTSTAQPSATNTNTSTSTSTSTSTNTSTVLPPTSTQTTVPSTTSTAIAITATATPIPATATSTVSSATPTVIPTVCIINFTDVPEGSVFYPYIRCLACRGIVSGYSTNPPCTTGIPCFQPYSNVTRGQMAKFISNAANYQDVIPQTQQTFTDVPYGSPFWLYVGRAYLHSVIIGYSTSPPCASGTPCFLPYNDVTRGQTAKFVSNAANYHDAIPTGQQTFTDVPNSDPFWLYIERVYLHEVISGYTTDPPCSSGTPCFLTYNSVTRGQTAKFISNTFFPNCQTPSKR